jgi:predicted glycosyltransferase
VKKPKTDNTIQAPRIAVFTHDTFGLGHVRRCLNIIQAVARHEPDAAVLLVSGCPVLPMVNDLPPNCDYVKVPTIVKTGSDGNKPPHLPLPLKELSAIRSALIAEAVVGFQPDVFLVDNFPLGSGRELLPALKALRDLGGHNVLGLRDIVDRPEIVIADWSKNGTYEVLESLYDRVLVYGMPEILNVAKAYQVPATVAARVHYCGYVAAPPPATEAAGKLREELGIINGPMLLGTTGGGGDGFPLLKTLLEALPLLPRLSAILVTGPMMSVSERSELECLADATSGVRLIEFVQDLRPYIAAADVVVAMAGYNTTAEIAAIRPRALLVPRTWRYGEHQSRNTAGQEWEQMLRARALEKLGLVDVLGPEDLKPLTLAQSISRLLTRPESEIHNGISLDGSDNAAAYILDLAHEAANGRRP